VLTIDARVVVAGVDAYLRFAELCGRMDLTGGTPRIGGTRTLELPLLAGQMAAVRDDR
jgi:hypothetical protein